MNKKSILHKDWREERRLQAWKLYEKDWKQKDIAVAQRAIIASIIDQLKNISETRAFSSS